MNEIVPCLAFYDQKIRFVVWKSRQREIQALERKRQRRYTGTSYLKVIFTIRLNQFLLVIIHNISTVHYKIHCDFPKPEYTTVGWF